MELGINQLRATVRSTVRADKAAHESNRQLADFYIDLWLATCREMAQTYTSAKAYKNSGINRQCALDVPDSKDLMGLLRYDGLEQLNVHLRERFWQQRDLWAFDASVEFVYNLRTPGLGYFVVSPVHTS